MAREKKPCKILSSRTSINVTDLNSSGLTLVYYLYELASASSDLPPSVVPGLRAFFRLINHTVPVQKYWDYP